MTGQALHHIERLKNLAREGLTYREAAQRLDLCVAYVKVIAKRSNIVLVRDPKAVNPHIEEIRSLAAKGLTRKRAADQLGLSYSAVVRYAIENKINFGREGKAAPSPRTRQMAALFQSGKTLHEIGEQYGITRERVRQIITRFHGLRGGDGGARKIASDRRAKLEAKRNARSLAKWGCNFDEYLKLRGKIITRFNEQKRNAKVREIPWELNLWQWWSIWQHSGHWQDRGRGQGYCMCRFGDEGPYSVGNVFIAPCRVNSSDQPRKKNGLPIGVRKNKRYAGYTAYRSINGVKMRLGSHPTPELAYAAYLAAGRAQ